jgi:predicted Fe-Mo cluster-binding NifX family protein
MGGEGYPPEIMAKEGADVLICRGLGRRAITMFKEFGIEVYIGAFGTVEDAIKDYKQGKLQKAGLSDACGQHAFRDHHNHEYHKGHCQ